MWVHSCRHCGDVFERYIDLRRHVESHATPFIDQHTEIHVCERCGLSFTRRDNLQRHARTTCCLNVKTTYKRCGRAFAARDRLKRHIRRCNDKPPVPKLSRPATTTETIPLIEDTVLPPCRLPFSNDLSTDLQDVIREHWSTIRTSVARGTITD